MVETKIVVKAALKTRTRLHYLHLFISIVAGPSTQLQPRRASLGIRERLSVPIQLTTSRIARTLLSLRGNTATQDEETELDAISSSPNVLPQPGPVQARQLGSPTVHNAFVLPCNLPTTRHCQEESQLDTEAGRFSQDLEAQLELRPEPDTPHSFPITIPGWRYRNRYAGLLLAFAIVQFIQILFTRSSSSSGGGAVGTIVIAPAPTGGFI
jgi:hypothetical protein